MSGPPDGGWSYSHYQVDGDELVEMFRATSAPASISDWTAGGITTRRKNA